MDWPETMPHVVWAGLHGGAIAVALLSRLSLGVRADAALQLLTMAGLCLVAGSAVVAGANGGDQFRLWVLSGTTLGLMVVAAVVERGPARHDPSLARFAAEEG